MEKEFDPYHKWLGIPAEEQPPNHYRLLGVPLYTSDLDVIENAADRQMAHIRRLASGKHAELSQKVLNELASARGCLLNAEQKARYDSDLRRKIAAATPAPAAIPIARALPLEPQSAPVPKQLKTRGQNTTANTNAAAGNEAFEFAVGDARSMATGSTSRSGTARGRKKSGPSGLLVAALMLIVAAIGLGVWFTLQKPASDDPQQGTAVAQSNDAELSQSQGINERLPAEPYHEPATQRTAEPEQYNTPADPNGSDASLAPADGENETPMATDNPSNDSLARSDGAATLPNTNGPLDETAVPVRKPLPSPAELAPAQARVREVFRVANDAALASRQAEENISDAGEMLSQSKNSSEPVEVRFALLTESLRLSLAAQHADSLNAAVVALQSQFETDGWSLVAEAAKNLPAANDEARKLQAAFFLELVPACQAVDAYRPALQLAEAAQEVISPKGKRALDLALRKQSSELIEQLTSLADMHDAYESALATLEKSTAGDAEQSAAHLAAGSYLAFIREDWPAGCKHLADSGDARLAAAAQADLEGQQSNKAGNASAAKKRGDLWFDFGERGKAFMRLPSKRRAGHWYTMALPELKGRDKQNVEKRLAELDRELGPASQLLADVPQKDSWGRTERTGNIEFMYEGEKMLHSLWTNPSGDRASFVTYDIDRKFIALRGEVSIDDSARGKIQSDLIFTILGDGQPLWRSPPVGITQLKVPFDVNIKNVQTLTVQCECTGSEGYVHGVWLDPMLFRR